jgi:hypothetical protein
MIDRHTYKRQALANQIAEHTDIGISQTWSRNESKVKKIDEMLYELECLAQSHDAAAWALQYIKDRNEGEE